MALLSKKGKDKGWNNGEGPFANIEKSGGMVKKGSSISINFHDFKLLKIFLNTFSPVRVTPHLGLHHVGLSGVDRCF